MGLPVTRAATEITGSDKSGPAWKSAGKSADSVNIKFGNVAKTAGLVGAATIAAAAALGGFTIAAVESADEIAKTADGIGITTDALQEYRFAAQLAGVETAQIDGAFQTFGKRLGELKVGTGTLTTFLDKYDTTLKETIRTSSDTGEALDVILEAMAGIEDQAERAAFASANFGRTAGIRMVNLVKGGTEALDAMRQEARDLGLVLDEELLRGAENANDALTRTRGIVGVNFQKVLLSLAPIIERIGLAFGQAAPAIADLAEKLVVFFGGIELLGLQGLNRELAETDASIKQLQFSIDTAVGAEVTAAGIAIEAEQKKRAEILRTIELREAEAEARRKLFTEMDEAEQVRTNKQDEARRTEAEKLTASLEEKLLKIQEAEEVLIQRDLDNQFRKIENAALTQAEADEARAIAQEVAALRVAEVQRSVEEQIEIESQQHADRLIQNNARAAAANKAIFESGLQGQLSIAGKFFGQIAALQNSKSKAMFKIGKAAAIAQATIDTFTAANGAYSALASIPIIGPALGAAAAAAAVVAGLINVRKIASQKFEGGGSTGGGGGGGGGISAGGVAAPGGTGGEVPQLEIPEDPEPRQIFLQIEGDNQVFSQEWLRDVFAPAIGDAQGDGVDFIVQTETQ